MEPTAPLRWEIARWLKARWWLALAAAALPAAAATLATGAPTGGPFFSVAVTLGLLLVMLLAPVLAVAAWLEVVPGTSYRTVGQPPVGGILLATLLGVALQTAVLAVLVLLPAVSSVLLGAVPGQQVLAAGAVIVAAGLLMVSVTTFGVARLRAPWPALALAYTVAVAITIGATTVAAFLPTSDGHPWPPEPSEIAGYINPLAALLAVVRRQVPAFGWLFPAPLGDYLSPGSMPGPRLPVWPVYLGTSAAVVLTLSALTLFKTYPRRGQAS